MAVSSVEYGAMVFSWAAYGVMVGRSPAYGATVCSCGPTAMTPLIAALLAAIVLSTPRPLAPPPPAATACACRVVLVGSAFSLANRAGWAWITVSSGANFTAFASCVLYVVAVASTGGGLWGPWAVPVRRMAAAVAITDGGPFCASAPTAGRSCPKAS